MGRTADTLAILADGDSAIFSIKRLTQVYGDADNPIPYESANVTDTATGLSFDRGGSHGRGAQYVRDARGELVMVDRAIFFMPTADVQVGDRLVKSGESDYNEALSVLRYSDHLEVLTRKVEGR